MIILENSRAVLQWPHPFTVATWKSWSMTINNDGIGRKCSTHDSFIEFGGYLYLVEGGRCSDKRDAGKGDLTESWDMMHPIADEVISLIGSDRISDKLRF